MDAAVESGFGQPDSNDTEAKKAGLANLREVCLQLTIVPPKTSSVPGL